MTKRTPSMITAETAQQVKQMSVPELNTYLYAVYRAGYADAIAETVTAAVTPAAAPKEGEPGAG